MSKSNTRWLVEENEDLRNRARRFLAQQNVSSLRNVQVQADRGNLIISGKVPTFYAKQLASHCCRHVAGVIRVQDKIEVCKFLRDPAPNIT